MIGKMNSTTFMGLSVSSERQAWRHCTSLRSRWRKYRRGSDFGGSDRMFKDGDSFDRFVTENWSLEHSENAMEMIWNPETQQSTDPILAPPSPCRGNEIFSKKAGWKIQDAPNKPGIVTEDKWAKNTVFWDQKHTRLTYAGCVFVILTMTATARYAAFPYDFDSMGRIRRGRVPKDLTVVVSHNNVNFLLVFCDTYILTGAHTSVVEWLLREGLTAQQRSQ